MQVRLGEELAACPHCGGTEFAHVEPGEELTYFTPLMCASCESISNHGTLVLQISERALKAARDKLQEPPRGPRKSRR